MVRRARSGARLMKPRNEFHALALGQEGYRFQFGSTVVYIDPYLSNYVETVEGPDLRRLHPILFPPSRFEIVIGF